MSEQTGKHGPAQDDYLGQEVRNTGRVEEFHEAEPGLFDDERARDVQVPEGRRGSPAGMTHADVELRAGIARVLGPHAFPGDRDRLVEAATHNGADDEVLDRLGQLPVERRFETMHDLVIALGIPTETRRN